MPIREISADLLRDALEQGHAMTILDVRPADERGEWSIPGSRHVDAYASLWAGQQDTLRDAVADLSRDQPVVVACGHGRTSLLAAEALAAFGFTDVASLAGGMTAWSEAWNVAEVPLSPAAGVRIVQVRRTGKGCLSYIIGSRDEAAVVDPAVRPEVYERLAASHGWQITAVLDTHVHADHVSRATPLAAATGATLYMPPQTRVRSPFTEIEDGETITIGNTTIQAVHTPGHTHESTCFVVDDAAVCTGDTLFVNSVGRPDLKAEGDEPARRARLLFQSLHERVLALPDWLTVLPGHASVPLAFDGVPHAETLGHIREALPVTRLDENGFVATVLTRIPPTPPNHLRIVNINEGKEAAPENLTALEAGANRCAIAMQG